MVKCINKYQCNNHVNVDSKCNILSEVIPLLVNSPMFIWTKSNGSKRHMSRQVEYINDILAYDDDRSIRFGVGRNCIHIDVVMNPNHR